MNATKAKFFISIALILVVAAGLIATRFFRQETSWPVSLPELERIDLSGDPLSEADGRDDEARDYKLRTWNEMEADQARQLIAQKIFLVRSLFQEEKSPYPGMTSNIVTCPKEFWPKIEEKETGDFIEARIQIDATSRNTFGVCAEEEFARRSVYLFIYCKASRRALKIEGFVDKERVKETDTWLSQAKCLP
jgi:hypothetical protein